MQAHTRHLPKKGHGGRQTQGGSSLIFSLMALVLLSLAAVGLVRSVDTGSLIAGNLGFKHDATLAASGASEQAMAWLLNKLTTGGSSALDADDATGAYYSYAKDDLDMTGNSTSAAAPMQVVNWDGNCQGLAAATYSSCNITPYTGTPVNGNKVQWVITRLCDYTGATPVNAAGQSNLCTKPPSTSGSGGTSDRGSLGTGKRLTSTGVTPYYRIVVRVEGARNTVSYVETVVHF